MDASELGPLADARICLERINARLEIDTLFGETYFGCIVNLPSDELTEARAQQAVKICGDTARRLAGA